MFADGNRVKGIFPVERAMGCGKITKSTIYSSGNEVSDLSSAQERYKEVEMRWEVKAQIYSISEQAFRPGLCLLGQIPSPLDC